MKEKFLQILLSLFSCTGALFGLSLTHSVREKICEVWTIEDCRQKIYSIGNPIFILLIPIAATAFILLFFHRKIFFAWIKFVAVALPLAVLWVFNTPVTSRGWDVIPSDREGVAWFAGTLFLIGSLIVIGWKWWRLRKENTVRTS
jgi:hypothetical protein